jgi:hypothetical protein
LFMMWIPRHRLSIAVRDLFGRGARVAVLLGFVVHFALTLVYVSPLNPLKMLLRPLVYTTIGVYFPQNWNFFAPSPLSVNYTLLVRPLQAQDLASASGGRLPADGWYDITAPLWSAFQKNRFSAYDRLARAQSAGIRTYLGSSPELDSWVDACKNGDGDACTFTQRQSQISRAGAASLLSKVASAFCNERFLNQNVTSVALRIRRETPPSWSQRYTGKPIAEDINVGIFPIDRTIAASGVYAGGGS